MIAWLPSIITLILGILSQSGADKWIASNPKAAGGLMALYALLKGLLPSPMTTDAEPPAGKPLGGLRSFALACACLMLMAAPAQAQQVVSIDLNKSALQWDWTQAGGSAVGNFAAKCGNVSGTYSKITSPIDPQARRVPVASIIAGPGEWFCVVVAVNQFGESGPSNELHFFAGSRPDGTLTLELIGS